MNFNFRSALKSYLTGEETFDLDHSNPGIPDIEEISVLLKGQVSTYSIEQLSGMIPELIDSVPFGFLNARVRELYTRMTEAQQTALVSGLARLYQFHDACLNSPIDEDIAQHIKYRTGINKILNHMVETPQEFVTTFTAIDDNGRRILIDAVLLADKLNMA